MSKNINPTIEKIAVLYLQLAKYTNVHTINSLFQKDLYQESKILIKNKIWQKNNEVVNITL